MGLILLFAIFSLSCSHSNLQGLSRSPSSTKPERKNALAVQKQINVVIEKILPGKASQNSEPKQEPPPMPSILSREILKSEITSCIESTCGPASKNWAALNVPYRPGNNLQPSKLWNEKFKPWLERMAVEEHESKIVEFGRMIEIVRSGEAFDEKQPGYMLMKALPILGKISKKISTLVEFAPNGKEVKFRAEEFDKISFQSAQEKQIALAIFEAIYLPLFKQAVTANDPLANALTKRLKTLYPSLDLKTAQKKDANAIISAGNELQNKVGGLLGQAVFGEFEKNLLTKAAEGNDLSKTESELYSEIASSINVFSTLMMGSIYDLLLQLPFDQQSIFNRLRSGNELDDQLAEMKKVSIKERVEKISKLCEEKLSKSMSLNTSELRLRQAKKMIEDAKNAAKIVVARYADPAHLEAVRNEISKLEFSMPESNREIEQGLADIFTSTEESVRRSKRMMKGNSAEVRQMFMLGGLSAALNSEKNQDEKEFGDQEKIKKACEALPINTISDFALTSLGKISMSWYSANYPEVGTAIVAHEIGHMVSTFLRVRALLGANSDKFVESLSCVANRNPYVLNPKTLSVLENTGWSEEDWADHFSSLVMDQLAAQKSPWASNRNFGCALTMPILQLYYYDSSLAPEKDDTHSAGVLRMLMIAKDRNQLTSQCEPLLDYSKSTNRQLNCP